LLLADEDGRLRDPLVYHGAHTGRWSGRAVQLHNLPRPHGVLNDLGPLIAAVDDPDRFRSLLPATTGMTDVISALIRPCFRAGSGRALCIADLAGIEARGLAWCAGEQRSLELFATGGDVYLDLATAIFGRTISREDVQERHVGKIGVLGCGYGMGHRRFAAYAAGRGVDLAAAGTTAEAVVDGYRDAHPGIAGTRDDSGGRSWRRGGLWRDFEAAAKDATTTGSTRSTGHCHFLRDGDALVVGLPSGRRLYYPNARIEDIVPAYCQSLGLPPRAKPTLVYDSPTAIGVTTYGGKLAENIVQAICRDLLAHALIECERQGLSIVLHVHDGIVVESLREEAEQVIRRLTSILSTPPPWAAGFPIEVEGFASERYLKGPPPGTAKVRARDGRILGPP
jgi:DNA polymerase bacteriophage-type